MKYKIFLNYIIESYHLLAEIALLFERSDSVDFTEKPSIDPKICILNQIGTEI